MIPHKEMTGITIMIAICTMNLELKFYTIGKFSMKIVSN